MSQTACCPVTDTIWTYEVKLYLVRRFHWEQIGAVPPFFLVMTATDTLGPASAWKAGLGTHRCLELSHSACSSGSSAVYDFARGPAVGWTCANWCRMTPGGLLVRWYGRRVARHRRREGQVMQGEPVLANPELEYATPPPPMGCSCPYDVVPRGKLARKSYEASLSPTSHISGGSARNARSTA